VSLANCQNALYAVLLPLTMSLSIYRPGKRVRQRWKNNWNRHLKFLIVYCWRSLKEFQSRSDSDSKLQPHSIEMISATERENLRIKKDKFIYQQKYLFHFFCRSREKKDYSSQCKVQRKIATRVVNIYILINDSGDGRNPHIFLLCLELCLLLSKTKL